MEKLFEAAGASSVLAAICVVLTLRLVADLGKFLWEFKEKKDAVTESSIKHLSTAVNLSTSATEKLENRMKALEHTISDITKFKTDLRRFYAALKLVAGDDWDVIRRKIMDDEATL